VRPLAILLLLLAACAPAWAQEPPDTPDEPEAVTETRQDSAAAPAPAPRLGPVTVEWHAPDPLKKLFVQFLPPPTFKEGERRRGSLRPWMRDVRRRVPEIAGAEGYFSAAVEIAFKDEDRDHVVITVTPGVRTTVGEVHVDFQGDLALEGGGREARREKLREGFAMKPGQPFRSEDWDRAKARLVEELASEDYAAGELAESIAQVDAEAARANLRIVLDSGPVFTLGDVEIHGIDKYSEAVVRRVVDLRRGERYRADRLTQLQRLVQEGPWFSSVVVDVERNRERHEMVPVSVTVTERPRREVGVAPGYGTDEGARLEVAFQHRDLFDRGFDLQSSVRWSEEHSFGFIDVYMPPTYIESKRYGMLPYRDSVGVLVERSDTQNLTLRRFAVAGYRHFKLDNFETRVGLSYQIEQSHPQAADERIKRALAPIIAVTWRHVNDIFDPRTGGVLNIQLAAGSKALASGDDFLKTYAQYQYWIPLGPMDQLLLRAELGRTHTPGRELIPEDFLFRAGGSRSNRGYAYQSLGVAEGEAVVGGRYLSTGTVEYVHWLNERWGAATFVDVGDAKDSSKDMKANPSYGVGARFKTPAGPFAIDLAYAHDLGKVRLAFSVSIAF
jgi:translocation and assembly module TamA